MSQQFNIFKTPKVILECGSENKMSFTRQRFALFQSAWLRWHTIHTFTDFWTHSRMLFWVDNDQNASGCKSLVCEGQLKGWAGTFETRETQQLSTNAGRCLEAGVGGVPMEGRARTSGCQLRIGSFPMPRANCIWTENSKLHITSGQLGTWRNSHVSCVCRYYFHRS